jgi:predicted phosphodiesterase
MAYMGSCPRRIVVLSDFHFGEDGALLSRPDVIERLIEELEGLGEIDLLVLLGDIWDLWRTGFEEAARAGAPFFHALTDWSVPKRCVMVAGNHDYHLWAFSDESRKHRKAGWEEVKDFAIVIDERSDAEERICLVERFPLTLCYPLLCVEVGGKTVLFTHGHHLDFFSRSFWWAKTYWLARGLLGGKHVVTLSDLDLLNRPFFEVLTQTARVPELRSWEYRFYGVLRFLARLLRFESKSGGSPRRYTNVDGNTGEARTLMRELLPGYIPDLFVFGHTHRAGFSRIHVGGRQVLLANSGCWLEGSGAETSMTYLIIDDAVRLRHLGDAAGEVVMDV